MCNIEVKDRIRNILHKLGKIKVLPASIINNIKIKENHDPMVDIKDDEKLFFSAELQRESHVYLRKSVYNKLKNIQLPKGYYIKIMSAYRSLDEQKKRQDSKYKEIQTKYPELTENELVHKVKILCADPRVGFGGHQTGGAIDITLCDKNGKDYDMGSAYRASTPQIHTDNKNITPQQKQHRKILIDALKQLDFANYPLEWWHHSYGDRLWAAYKHHNQCMYGMPENNEFSNVRKNEQNDVNITFCVPIDKENKVYEGELMLNELRGADTRNLAQIACDMAWNDTIKLLLKDDKEKYNYEQFLQISAPDLLPRWHNIMQYRPIIIHEGEKILNKPFAEMTPKDKNCLYNKIDKNMIPIEHWHINFSQLKPDLTNKHDEPVEAFLEAAKKYIDGATQRRGGNDKGIREGFWLAIRDKESYKLLGVMALSTKIIKGNLIGHSARFISPDYQRQKIAGTAGFVALDFMYKYLIDVEQPNLYQENNKPLFATTCHPFNSASRGLQGHNGAKFKGYNAVSHKFEYTTERSSHEEKLNQSTSIIWSANYKGKTIKSQTGMKFQLSIEKENTSLWFQEKILTKNAKQTRMVI